MSDGDCSPRWGEQESILQYQDVVLLYPSIRPFCAGPFFVYRTDVFLSLVWDTFL
ncbi:MAG: hypothetical protein ACXVJ5_01435 [Flavisolibacter sp.]